MPRPLTVRLFYLLVVILGVMMGEVPASDPPHRSPRAPRRLREGTQVQDVAGRFAGGGEQVSFVFADSGGSVRILENLALERVSRFLPTQGQNDPQWIVSGVITEYHSENYLLLTKAVQSNAASTKAAVRPSGIGTHPKGDYSGAKAKPPAEKIPESSHDKRP